MSIILWEKLIWFLNFIKTLTTGHFLQNTFLMGLSCPNASIGHPFDKISGDSR